MFFKFQPKKYDFDLYKQFFMQKMEQSCETLNFKKSKGLESFDIFKKITKNIIFLNYFHIYYVAKLGSIILWMIIILNTPQNL